ncbi:hypothetical protein SR870_04080 [Rhodopseudomonas palustris]|uniref:hypothetical protein n=1 Tax=Rhodopseudomonas palustris TaxID=1076 RepID=UPI002ACD3F44|nr:hypothetical protein [Rhodopseudomonas palustris]WQH00484.1 hypothetical protein SR870_04080 [Rhodopseudomonas palustris]
MTEPPPLVTVLGAAVVISAPARPAYAADLRPGASIALLAGAGSSGTNYAAVAALYLDPANRAVAGTPLTTSRARSPRPTRWS